MNVANSTAFASTFTARDEHNIPEVLPIILYSFWNFSEFSPIIPIHLAQNSRYYSLKMINNNSLYKNNDFLQLFFVSVHDLWTVSFFSVDEQNASFRFLLAGVHASDSEVMARATVYEVPSQTRMLFLRLPHCLMMEVMMRESQSL